jgi:Uma2 family endonuclease
MTSPPWAQLQSSPASTPQVRPIANHGLPTMYELPSDDPLEPGLPNEFHGLQPQLLAETLHLKGFDPDDVFQTFDMNLYYDPQNPGWYKRPDWFLVMGVSRLYQGRDTRSSYVIWDEQVSPTLVVEFLSPGTEAEDLGRFANRPLALTPPGKPPSKFTVYEEILQIPNYVVYSEVTQKIRYFRLVNGRYSEQALATQPPLLWIPELDLGLGLWRGTFRRAPKPWLRWCDAQGNWLLTGQEQERQAKEEALRGQERERQAKERLAAYLRSQGIDPDNLPPL